MAIKLMGVVNTPGHKPADALGMLEDMLNAGEVNLRAGIGLQISDRELAVFEETYQSPEDHESKLRSAAQFWYEIFKFAKKHRIQLQALDSEPARTRLAKSEAEILRKSAEGKPKEELTGKEKQALLKGPNREHEFVSKILSTYPNVVIVGSLHVEDVKKLLEKENQEVAVVFKDKEGLGSLTDLLHAPKRIKYKLKKKDKRVKYIGNA
jgi:hypothetical protein